MMTCGVHHAMSLKCVLYINKKLHLSWVIVAQTCDARASLDSEECSPNRHASANPDFYATLQMLASEAAPD